MRAFISTAKVVSLLFGTLVIGGCASTPPPPPEFPIAPISDDRTATKSDDLDVLTGANVAVLPFIVEGGEPSWAISTELSLLFGKTKKYNMIERGQLEKLFAEQDIDTSRLDDAAAVQIGRTLGAKGVVVGTVSSAGVCNVRLVDSETSRILFEARVQTPRGMNPQVLYKLINNGVGGSTPGLISHQSSADSVSQTARQTAIGIISLFSDTTLQAMLAQTAFLPQPILDYYKVSRSDNGVMVGKVYPTSAALGVLKVGDLLVGVEGRPILTGYNVVEALLPYQSGESVNFTIQRNGEILTLPVPLSPNL